MRMDQDAIPGLRVPMWFRPTKSGNYEIVCAQLCGSGHYSMKGNMTVGTQAEYDSWAMGIIKQQHPDYQAPAAPAGTTTAAAAAPAPAAK
jgi:cytochrome c oxidase subunit 2